jgi:hypothetical protein
MIYSIALLVIFAIGAVLCSARALRQVYNLARRQAVQRAHT